jgi:hypothetical protein
MPELAVLRELPPEVSLAQVEQWVALFPAAPPPKPWYRNINFNTIIMTTATTLLLGGLLYFLRPGPTTPPSVSQAIPPAAQAIESDPAPPAVIEPAASLTPATTPSAQVRPVLTADPAPDAPLVAVDPAPAASRPVQVPGPSAGPSPAPSATPPTAPTQFTAAAPTSETERRFDLTGFEKATLLGSLHVEFYQGPFSVVAIGPTDELPYVEATVKGGTLTIRQKDHREVQAEGHPKRRTRVWLGPVTIGKIPGGSSFSTRVVVHLPNLSGLVLSGSGDALLGRFTGPGAMELSVQGSGDIEALALQDLSALRLDMQGSGRIMCRHAEVKGRTDLDLAGSGDIVVAGSTTQLDVSLTGSGDVDAGNFVASHGNASLVGSGNAAVHYTSAQVTTTVVGSGDLKRVGPSERKD